MSRATEVGSIASAFRRKRRRTARRKTSSGRRLKSVPITKTPRSRALKQKRGRAEVLWSLQSYLIRRGHIPGPGRLDWKWQSFVDSALDFPSPIVKLTQVEKLVLMPRYRGERPNLWWMFGLDAAVMKAGVVALESFDWVHGPLGRLLERIESSQKGPTDIAVWCLNNQDDVRRYLQNMQSVDAAQSAFGPHARGTPAATARVAFENVLTQGSCSASICELERALRAIAPPPVNLSFYLPRGTGAMGHFEMLLLEEGLSLQQFLEVTGRYPTRRQGASQWAWKQAAETAVEAARRRTNFKKALANQRLGTKSLLGDVAQKIPVSRRWAVFYSVHVESCSTASVSV